MSNYRLNASIVNIPMPMRIKRLPISERGYPVPWFVQYLKDGKPSAFGGGDGGEPDFRVMDSYKLVHAIKFRQCWLCGGPLGKYMCFVIGPMCAVNRVSSEPPCHRDCAEYAVQACPFLTQPRMRRNTEGLPEDKHVSGIMIERNPGVTLIWTTLSYKIVKDGRGGFVINIGEPISAEFFARGRTATHDEIMASIDSGLPLLQAQAKRDGIEAEKELAFMYERALKLVPA